MNYEQKYKEALEKARQFSEHPLQEDSSSIVEYIFPELADSEDERIRKALIRFHKSTIDVDGIKGEDIIAWLEKQGTSFTKRDVDDAFVEGMAFAKDELEKQGGKTIKQPDFEIPFGAKDSELIEESYYIPKGYHAEISKDKVTIKKGEQKTNSQNAQDIIKKYVSDHADCRWLDASELEQLLNDFVLEYDKIKNRECEQQCKVSNDGNNR